MTTFDRVLYVGEAESSDDMATTLFEKRSRCFCAPCFGSRPSRASGARWWDRMRAADHGGARWWSPGLRAFKKVRDWSEIVAGPKWKTFIRRFNRRKGCSGGCTDGGPPRHGQFQYDAHSYALNFDDGPAANGDSEFDYGVPNFSSRYASIPVSEGKTPVDLSNGNGNVVSGSRARETYRPTHGGDSKMVSSSRADNLAGR